LIKLEYRDVLHLTTPLAGRSYHDLFVPPFGKRSEGI
jgi:hypothetical protein